jgi:hypothetical protein
LILPAVLKTTHASQLDLLRLDRHSSIRRIDDDRAGAPGTDRPEVNIGHAARDTVTAAIRTVPLGA